MRWVLEEWRILRREFSPGLLVACYSVLLAYGCWQSLSRVVARETQVQSATRDYVARWAALRDAAEKPKAVWGDWRSPSLVGGPTGFAVTWMPVEGLAALSAGEGRRQAWVRRISVYPAEEEPPLENPLAPAGGLFDLSFVVLWLMPLTIVAAVHGVVSGDRDRGIWSLIAASSRNPQRVVLARLTLPALLIASTTVVAGVVTVFSSSGFQADRAGRLVAWAGIVLAYTLLWAMLAGITTIRCANARSALVSLGLLWVTLVWLVPGLIDATVTSMAPPPNRLEAHIVAREVQRDLGTKLPGMIEDVYTRHPDWRPSPEVIAAATKPVPGGPASRDSRRVFAPALASLAAARPFLAAERERRERINQLIARASVFSPTLAVQLIGDHLAGTSAGHFLSFDQHTREAERGWSEFFAPRIMKLQELERADMDRVPTPAPFEARVDAGNIRWPLIGLLLSLVLVTALFGSSLKTVVR